MGDEGDEKAVTPEVNDPVSFTVEGVVKSVKGSNAEVEVRFINGERPGGKDDKPEKDAEPSDEDLSKMAEEADAEA